VPTTSSRATGEQAASGGRHVLSPEGGSSFCCNGCNFRPARAK
jgi:hypothetical protein